MASAFDITKVAKLNSRNYCDWRRIMEDVLILKDLWLHLDEAQPEDVLSADYHLWLKNQKHILAIIRLTCESEIVPLITDASTGTSAWYVGCHFCLQELNQRHAARGGFRFGQEGTHAVNE